MIRAAGLAATLATLAWPVVAQHRHAAMDGMPGMDMPAPAASTPAPASSTADGMAMPVRAASSAPMPMPMPMPMHGDHAPAAHGMSPDMEHGMRQAMPQGMPPGPMTMTEMSAPQDAARPAAPMAMGRMQGGAPPADARSPDYSDGVAPSHLPGMDMGEGARFVLLQVDQLEAFAGRDEHGQRWELHGWVGNDDDKLLLRSEGERTGSRVSDGDVEALWSHAVAAYWDSTLGARHDLGDGPRRDWLAFGVKGLAPYWFDVEATGYLGRAGRTAVRLRADYEVLFTQRLILQPELEANLYGRDDPRRGIGRGLSDLQFGLRLRYEIRREVAPYVGVQYVRRLGRTADFARAAGTPVSDRQVVVGLRVWF
ncbi:MAG: copper resistance protein B [Xanthomonadaceae bacterium]|nr:copper resistance protein B [Xanthomonadaceae bacterium]MDE1964270.1 copper resistance protein B [Xanthomonadaceae bacterium]